MSLKFYRGFRKLVLLLISFALFACANTSIMQGKGFAEFPEMAQQSDTIGYSLTWTRCALKGEVNYDGECSKGSIAVNMGRYRRFDEFKYESYAELMLAAGFLELDSKKWFQKSTNKINYGTYIDGSEQVDLYSYIIEKPKTSWQEFVDRFSGYGIKNGEILANAIPDNPALEDDDWIFMFVNFSEAVDLEEILADLEAAGLIEDKTILSAVKQMEAVGYFEFGEGLIILSIMKI